MSSWLGSQSKNWTRGKLKHSPNGVKSMAFLSHLSSTSLPLSLISVLSLSLSSQLHFSLSSQQTSPAQPLSLFAHAVVGLVSNFVVLSPPFKGFFSAPRVFVTADLPFVGPRSLCEPCASCTVWVSSPLIVCVCVWLRCWLLRFGFEFGALVIGGH
jgi:hypothetical protein